MLVPAVVKVGGEVEAVVERFQSGRVLEEEEVEGFERGVRKKTCFLILLSFLFWLLLGEN